MVELINGFESFANLFLRLYMLQNSSLKKRKKQKSMIP
jgi:hypothetical protein